MARHSVVEGEGELWNSGGTGIGISDGRVQRTGRMGAEAGAVRTKSNGPRKK